MTLDKLADDDDPFVRDTAARVIDGEQRVQERLRKLFHFVRDDVVFGFPQAGDLVRASDTIAMGMGQCNTKATLFLALCRCVRIPARIHFSLIRKEIQRGLFTGFGYAFMPTFLSHSWLEVNVDGSWHAIDSYINDVPFYRAARKELETRGWDTGFSLSCPGGNCSCRLDLDKAVFVQMAAVVADHGTWKEPGDYYGTDDYHNRPSVVKSFLYRAMIGRVNRRIEKMRQAYHP